MRLPARFIVLSAVTFAWVTRLFAGNLPSVEDERRLALLNCGRAEAPAEWKPVAQWTFPGNFPKRAELRAYHAVSFGSGEMNVNYMVCHLGRYRRDEDARLAYASASLNGRTMQMANQIGDRAVITESVLELGDGSPIQMSYQILFQRGPFLFQAGIVSVAPWSHGQLWSFLESLDCRLADDREPAGAADTGAMRLDDPRRPPRCDRKCEVHGQAMAPVAVPIAYGLPGLTLTGFEDSKALQVQVEYWQERPRHFPNSPPTSVGGGCMVDELLSERWVCACSACVDFEAKWRADRDYSERRQ